MTKEATMRKIVAGLTISLDSADGESIAFPDAAARQT